jgi:CubicO group peptidase (beta-lactamase class C family)
MKLRRIVAIAVALATTAATWHGRAETPDVSRSLALDGLMRLYHDSGHFDGAVLVGEGDEVLYAAAFGAANREWDIPHSIDTKFEIASMTKPMTALIVMQLVEEGKVRLDAPVARYVPYFGEGATKAITVEQLLNHTSGLLQDIAFPESGQSPDLAARINADQLSLDELVKQIAARPLRFAPGAQFGYSSDAYAVLGAVIERITGKSYWDVLKERVLTPAGMAATEVARLRPLIRKRAIGYRRTFIGIENAQHIGPTPAGGLYSTVFDLYRWDRALYGNRIASDETKNLLFARRSAVTAYGWKTAEEDWGAGKHLVLRTTGGLPGFRNLLVRIPHKRRVIILLSNVRGPVDRFDAIAETVNRLLDGVPHDPPRRSVAQMLAPIAHASTAEESVARFQVMRSRPSELELVESEMNALGYELLSIGKSAAAITVFRLNVESFPQSPNAYDSLGEAFMIAGDKPGAIENYEKVLQLDPGNENAKAMLRKLQN